MAHGEVRPLDTLDELLAFTDPQPCIVERMREVNRGDGQAPRVMFCHDLMGGYLEDRFINGCDNLHGYRFHHWQLIDSFVYYAHHLVTIPPPGWISAGHIHGVKVLGTFSVRSVEGIQFINKIRGSRLEKEVVSRLARIATFYNFDGWLVSIACRLDFLRLLTEEMHSAVPGSMVIWYDAVARTGKCARQNELNSKNAPFFDMCDGIFLHFKWTEDMLEDSARFAGDRKNDVYVGIDVFARKTEYAGGFETCKAVAQARKYGLSAGIFAAGWVYETQDRSNFIENQCRIVPLTSFGRNTRDSAPCRTTGPVPDEQQQKERCRVASGCSRQPYQKAARRLASLFSPPARPQGDERVRVAEESVVKQRPRERGPTATKPGIPIKGKHNKPAA
ncbi:hypothetical protein HPB52_019403 [Rhipicephalus sanguineus]|uniref:Cytosolic endo-beta-N-acetylglucosaminidase TIM barrel domain-containing protein n=1 Tax=Rhipicephalus sanguineus TaxID=34632 RepID=A0A9D4YQM7_RHISA|nr:hypothetical protein HPB52_019403 [Rhipicephalus sanguineus]